MAADGVRVRSWWRVAPAVAAMAWGGNHFTPLLLLYRQVDGYSSLQVDLFLAFYVVGLVPGFLVVGPLSDRLGRRPLVVAGVALSIVASIVLAAASTPLWMCTGRLVAGASVAVAMVVGTTWIDELSSREDRVARGRGARRASLALTAGFGVGAGVAGALAQWAPLPTLLPYLVQIALAVAAGAALIGAPETRPQTAGRRSLRRDLRVPRVARPRFLRVVAPSAPWVFGVAALAYVVTPSLLGDRVGGDRVAFSTLLTILTLGAGALVQPFVPRLAALTGGRHLLCGLALAGLGTALCALEAVWVSIALGIAIALVLGTAYGICLVAGFTEIQRLAEPSALAGLTAIYCCLTYVGFAVPVALAALAAALSYTVLLGALAVAAAVSCVAVARGLRTTRLAAS